MTVQSCEKCKTVEEWKEKTLNIVEIENIQLKRKLYHREEELQKYSDVDNIRKSNKKLLLDNESVKRKLKELDQQLSQEKEKHQTDNERIQKELVELENFKNEKNSHILDLLQTIEKQNREIKLISEEIKELKENQKIRSSSPICEEFFEYEDQHFKCRKSESVSIEKIQNEILEEKKTSDTPKKQSKNKNKKVKNDYDKYLSEENHTPFIQFQLSHPVYDEKNFLTAVKSRKSLMQNIFGVKASQTKTTIKKPVNMEYCKNVEF